MPISVECEHRRAYFAQDADYKDCPLCDAASIEASRLVHMIKVKTGLGAEVSINWLKFPGGEWHPKFEYYPSHEYTVEAFLYNADGILQLLLATEALRAMSVKPAVFYLRMPYFPYGRQDRRALLGEALSARVMANLINSLHFDSVEVWDAHSDVTTALINNCVNISPAQWVKHIPDLDNCIVVIPDSGAIKRVHAVVKDLQLANPVQADKCRDVATGQITETKVYSEHIGSKDFLIVDDICDGGRTFIELAKVLRPLTDGKIILYVTHGIFSKGLAVFEGLIDQVWCPHVWPCLPSHPYSMLNRILT